MGFVFRHLAHSDFLSPRHFRVGGANKVIAPCSSSAFNAQQQ